MKIVYIDHQNTKLWISELWRQLDWLRFYVYLKDYYKPDQICIFIWYIESEKELYDHYQHTGYSLFFKSTYQHTPESKPKWNIDTLLSHIATKDVLRLWESLKSCIIVSWDSDFDVIAKYRACHHIDYLWVIPNDKKLSKLILQTAKQEKIIPLNYLKAKLMDKTKTPTELVL